ncbi:MAG: hypothetical protein VKJ85_04810, partial [Prochlorothrix sp.]|nr:hypothetical protein [Prochlorothrix sp.]
IEPGLDLGMGGEFSPGNLATVTLGFGVEGFKPAGGILAIEGGLNTVLGGGSCSAECSDTGQGGNRELIIHNSWFLIYIVFPIAMVDTSINCGGLRLRSAQPNPDSAVGTAVKICIHRGALAIPRVSQI